jgi:Ring finger domain
LHSIIIMNISMTNPVPVLDFWCYHCRQRRGGEFLDLCRCHRLFRTAERDGSCRDCGKRQHRAGDIYFRCSQCDHRTLSMSSGWAAGRAEVTAGRAYRRSYPAGWCPTCNVERMAEGRHDQLQLCPCGPDRIQTSPYDIRCGRCQQVRWAIRFRCHVCQTVVREGSTRFSPHPLESVDVFVGRIRRRLVGMGLVAGTEAPVFAPVPVPVPAPVPNHVPAPVPAPVPRPLPAPRTLVRSWHMTTQHLECIICLEELEIGQRLLEMPGCQHIFHEQCAMMWLRVGCNCPTCRNPVRTDGKRCPQRGCQEFCD